MADLETFQGLDREMPLDTSSGEPAYLVIGRHGTHIRLSASAYNLLQAARSGLSWETLAEAVGRQNGRAVSAAELEASYAQVTERLAEIDDRTATRELPAGFWLRWPLLSRSAVGRIAARLAAAFSLWPALALLSVIGLVFGHALWQGLVPSFGGTDFWGAYALFTVSLIAHELGHVSACRRYGARPDTIGFTVYWIFPAFYSDVTTAWRLDRRHRVIVDLAGVFFQLAVGAVYWLAFTVTGWPAFAAAWLMILYGCLFSLNPIFKFDGYWMLADALGVNRLSRQPRRILRHLVDRWRGQPGEPLPWPPWVTRVLLVYTPLAIGFWGYFIARLAPEVWHRAVAYPQQLMSLLGGLARLEAPDWQMAHTLAVSTFLLLVSGLMIRHLATRLTIAWRHGLRLGLRPVANRAESGSARHYAPSGSPSGARSRPASPRR